MKADAIFHRAPMDTAFALRLICAIDVPVKAIEEWTDRQIQQAEDYAGAVHLSKTLPDVALPALPACLKPYAGRH